jgi:hypothetical protein
MPARKKSSWAEIAKVLEINRLASMAGLFAGLTETIVLDPGLEE